MPEEDLIFGKHRHLFGGIEPSNMVKFVATLNSSGVPKIEAVLPTDTLINGQSLCTVEGAVIRRSTSDYPKNEFEGTEVVTLTESRTFLDNSAEANGTYFYAAFPFTTQGVYNRSKLNRAVVNEPKPMESFNAIPHYDVHTQQQSIQITAILPSGIAGAIIRRGDNNYPIDEYDGTEIKNITSSEIIYDTSVISGHTYYYAAFPYTSTGAYNRNTEKNHTSATPAIGETVKVTVNIDDPVEFSSATISCVDESNSRFSQSSVVTFNSNTVSFTVPIGDRYHIEYGVISKYSKPENTQSRVAEAGGYVEYTGNYYYFISSISVEYPVGAVCTCSLNGVVYTAPTTTGKYIFDVNQIGTWIVAATKDGKSDRKEVSITSSGQNKSIVLTFANIYGIVRNITSTSPVWARTDKAVGKTVKAAVGTIDGHSDFDNCMPWSGMRRETFSTGDVMVKIPKFWYKRYKIGNEEHIQIADNEAEGFAVHPAFMHNGVQQSHIYVGAYLSSSKKLATAPLVSCTNDTADMHLIEYHRKHLGFKGSNWALMDVTTASAIQMLYLVEFANNDSQDTIGIGFDSGYEGQVLRTGLCDDLVSRGQLTGIHKEEYGDRSIVYRGIEGFSDMERCFIDGINFKYDRSCYICNDISKYTSNGVSGYQLLGFKIDDNDPGYLRHIQTIGIDVNNSWALIPEIVRDGSHTTYYCDGCTISRDCITAKKKYSAVTIGGGAGDKASGFFRMEIFLPEKTSEDIGEAVSRLIYIP